ncbi:MAG: hypothetical protein ACOCRK_09515 [bacterium]
MDIYLIMILSSLWVLYDAKKIGLKKGQVKGFLDIGYIGWFLACLFGWLLAFPLYLFNRRKLMNIAYITQDICPNCKGEINEQINFCINCESNLEEIRSYIAVTGEKTERSPIEKIFIFIFSLIFIFLIFLILMGIILG